MAFNLEPAGAEFIEKTIRNIKGGCYGIYITCRESGFP